MTEIFELKTERLLLRQWQTDDLEHFAQLNADPEVMQYLPAILDKKQSDMLAEKIVERIHDNGWGFWAVEIIKQKSFAGFVGLNRPTYALPVNPCVEIGWRLARQHWGKGYATEAARASMDFAFKQLDLDNLYAFTSIHNNKSSAVMQRLNMTNQNTNFIHPMVPEEGLYKEHVLYKISKQHWLKSSNF